MLIPLTILTAILTAITLPGLIALHLEDRRRATGKAGE